MSKIMVVDDEPDMILTTQMLLEKDGYEVVEANSGEECLRRLEKENPDLVLLDIMMPGLDGWEVCKRIKEGSETNPFPVVMFTVRTSVDSRKRSFDYAKADGQIDKPFPPKQLSKTIERLLKSSKEYQN